MTDTPVFDEQKAGAFAERMIGVLAETSVALQISIGHQVGLFDAMNGLAPSTSAEIAAAAGLHERYVREWLGTMVTGRVVDYDPGARTYVLAPEHAHFLSSAGGADNLARLMPMMAMLAEVEQPIIECFRHGGGVPYSRYPRFQALMAEDSTLVNDASLISTILPLVDGLVDRLQSGIDVLDVGCGQGHAINLIAQAFPNSRATGYDFSNEGVAAGRAESAALGLTNANHEARDVTDLAETAKYDLITAFDAIHDQAHPRKVLAGIARALRPGGVFLMGDIKASSNLEDNCAVPWGPFLYTVSTMHCMTVSLALGGEGLGTAWGRQMACELLAEAGFTSVEVKEIDGDPFNDYFVARKER
jgi:2-polyprenyl-3-methyl-5-hydroxy-6-metoxy-1,4-benzoquinol methylase